MGFNVHDKFHPSRNEKRGIEEGWRRETLCILNAFCFLDKWLELKFPEKSAETWREEVDIVFYFFIDFPHPMLSWGSSWRLWKLHRVNWAPLSSGEVQSGLENSLYDDWVWLKSTWPLKGIFGIVGKPCLAQGVACSLCPVILVTVVCWEVQPFELKWPLLSGKHRLWHWQLAGGSSH